MRKFLLSLIILLSSLTVYSFKSQADYLTDAIEIFQNPISPIKNTKTPKNIKPALPLTPPNLSGGKIINIPHGTLAYMKSNRAFNQVFTSNKLAVIHTYDDSPNCPYGRKFMREIKRASQDPRWQTDFQFIAYNLPTTFRGSREEMNNFTSFADTCAMFCILDLKQNKVYTFNGVNGSEVEPALTFTQSWRQ